MADDSLFDKLVVLNTVYNKSFGDNTDVVNSVNSVNSQIKTKLFQHQYTLVNGMHSYRNKMIRGFLLDNTAINGKVGIIGDSPGTGKTLSVLTYLATQSIETPRFSSELSSNSSKYFFSHDLFNVTDISSANLIIVPHNLFDYWKNEIATHTALNYVPIETKRVLRGDSLSKKISNSVFILTTNKCYKYVQTYAEQNGIQWNNVIIDEASSIYINSTDPTLKFQFLWLITNNWIPLLFKKSNIIKSTLYHLKDRINLNDELEEWLLDTNNPSYEGHLVSPVYLKKYLPMYHKYRGHIVLRTSAKILNTSLKLQTIQNKTIQCCPNISLNSLISYYLSRNRELHNINTHNIPNLFQALNIKSSNLEQYLVEQDATKHKLIRRKVDDGDCTICLEKAEYKTIVNCCYNIYCGKCLLKTLLINYKCPTCRNYLAIENICCLDEIVSDNRVCYKSKSDTLFDVLRNNKQGKFIIYSAFDNIYYQMFEQLDTIGLKAERLVTNIFSFSRSIKNFNDGQTSVLFVSDIELLRGVSLVSTSHLIFYHELTSCELKKILVHSAQRIGRTQPLQIIHLHSEIQV